MGHAKKQKRTRSRPLPSHHQQMNNHLEELVLFFFFLAAWRLLDLDGEGQNWEGQTDMELWARVPQIGNSDLI